MSKLIAIILIAITMPVLAKPVNAGMATSAAGREFIQRFEGVRLTAYVCAGGRNTIGYGHTAGVKAGQRITLDKAKEYLSKDLKRFEAHVIRAIDKRKLQSWQFDALVSFTFNVGYRLTNNLRASLNYGLDKQAMELISLYVHAKGKELRGLVRRRKAEIKLFTQGAYV